MDSKRNLLWVASLPVPTTARGALIRLAMLVVVTPGLIARWVGGAS